MATGTIKKPVTEFKSYSEVYWQNSTWTAQSSGIAIAHVTWKTNGADAYWYIDNVSDNYRVAELSTTDANGLSLATMFPVIKGKSYGTSIIAGVDGAWVRFFPFYNS